MLQLLLQTLQSQQTTIFVKLQPSSKSPWTSCPISDLESEHSLTILSYQPPHQFPFGERGGRGAGGWNEFSRRGGRGERQGRGGYQQRQQALQYCWTHGAGGHSSHECANPAPGHCHCATFDNKMGSSTYKCPNARAERAAGTLSPALFQRFFPSPSTLFVPNYQQQNFHKRTIIKFNSFLRILWMEVLLSTCEMNGTDIIE